jgi:hypothetical protein
MNNRMVWLEGSAKPSARRLESAVKLRIQVEESSSRNERRVSSLS